MSGSTTDGLRETSPTGGRLTPLERVTDRRKRKPRKIEMQNLCCVPGCGKLMEPLCLLPSDKTHQREWLEVIGDPSLKTKCHKAVYLYYRICRKHFTDEAFKNLNYKMKRLKNLNRFLNDTPTLHLPVITNKGISDMINLDNSKPTSPNQIELLAEKEAEQSNHFINTPTSSFNSNTHPCIAPLKTGAEPRTYCRKVKVKPEGNLGKKELFKSYAEIEISNGTETFSCSSIKKESIDLESVTELHKINEENVCIESDMFGKNASFQLQNYDHKTQIVVNKIKKERIDLETEKELHKIDKVNVLGKNDSLKFQNHDFKTQIVVNKIKKERIDLETEKELHKIDEEKICNESDMFGENASLKLQNYYYKTQIAVNKIKNERIDFETENELNKIDEENVCVESYLFSKHVSLKLQSFNQKTKTVVKNLIDTILLNAENGMYDTALTPTSSS